jgi:hypothetical protein
LALRIVEIEIGGLCLVLVKLLLLAFWQRLVILAVVVVSVPVAVILAEMVHLPGLLIIAVLIARIAVVALIVLLVTIV